MVIYASVVWMAELDHMPLSCSNDMFTKPEIKLSFCCLTDTPVPLSVLWCWLVVHDFLFSVLHGSRLTVLTATTFEIWWAVHLLRLLYPWSSFHFSLKQAGIWRFWHNGVECGFAESAQAGTDIFMSYWSHSSYMWSIWTSTVHSSVTTENWTHFCLNSLIVAFEISMWSSDKIMQHFVWDVKNILLHDVCFSLCLLLF